MKKLPLSFYLQDDVVETARLLIGKYLFGNIGNHLCGGMITETEAYAGITDRASHAFGGRRTKRTQTMYREGGISYVYFSYGMHHLFNVVTSTKGVPNAVLIRGIIPTVGVEIQQARRKMPAGGKQFTNGPAKVCQALGITLQQNAVSLLGNEIWLAGDVPGKGQNKIIAAPRVGVGYAGEDAGLLYRFILDHPGYFPVKNSVSKA